MKYKLPFRVLTLFLLCLLPLSTARSEIKQIRPMGFGSFIVLNNANEHLVTLSPEGSVKYPDEIIPTDEKPVPALYEVSILPPYAPISVDVPNTILTSSAQDNSFALTDFDIIAPNSDKFGKSLLKIGATLKTSGNGEAYNEDVYKGTMEITVNY